jgi:hypothetical protein
MTNSTEDIKTRLAEIDTRREAAFGTEWRREYSEQKGHTVWASVSPTGSMQIAAFGYADYDRANADFVASTRDDIGFLREVVDRLMEENRRWKLAIEGLTPHGSEYVDDPEACAVAIRERCRWPKQIIEARAEIERLRKENAEVALAELREMFPSEYVYIKQRHWFPEWKGASSEVAVVRVASDMTETAFDGATLEESMQKVREFAALRTKQEQK